MDSNRQYFYKLLAICTVSVMTSCSLSSGETFTRTESTSCNAMVFPDGEGTSEIQVHYEVPEAYETILQEGAVCSVTLGDAAISSKPGMSRFTWCEISGLPSDTKIVMGIDSEQKKASVVQSLNWTSLNTQMVDCVLQDGKYVCDGKVTLSTKPFYQIALSVGHSKIWTEGGDFDAKEKETDYFHCIEQVDPANLNQTRRFESVKVSDGRSGREWKCRFASGALAYEISSIDLKTAVLTGGAENITRQLTCGTHESTSSEH